MTPDERTRLIALQAELRAIAAPVGPPYSYWDDISEIDDMLADRETRLGWTAAQMIVECERMLAAYHATDNSRY